MKKPLLLIFAALLSATGFSQTSRTVNDCTITYTITSSDLTKTGVLSEAVKTVYIKGNTVRINLKSKSFKQTIFYNGSTGEVTVLKDVGDSKYISHYNSEEWKKENEIYNGAEISFLTDTKKVLNYDCKEALIKLKNGSTYVVFYDPNIIMAITENTYQFKEVPGLILEYETSGPGTKTVFTANAVNFDPVPSFQFEIPKSGYRVLH